MEGAHMILSRLFLNSRSREVRRDLADCQEMHRTVMSGLPQVNSSAARSELAVLFRVEESPVTGLPALLVQSRDRPDWSRLPENYLAATPGGQNPESKDLTVAWAQLRVGMRLNFRL